jgi:hypothetical protein
MKFENFPGGNGATNSDNKEEEFFSHNFGGDIGKVERTSTDVVSEKNQVLRDVQEKVNKEFIDCTTPEQLSSFISKYSHFCVDVSLDNAIFDIKGIALFSDKHAKNSEGSYVNNEDEGQFQKLLEHVNNRIDEARSKIAKNPIFLANKKDVVWYVEVLDRYKKEINQRNFSNENFYNDLEFLRDVNKDKIIAAEFSKFLDSKGNSKEISDDDFLRIKTEVQNAINNINSKINSEIGQ